LRYEIRSKEGGELVVHDGRQVIMLVRQRFLEPDDEIRREGQEKWRKLKDIPEYAAMFKAEKYDLRRFQQILIFTALLGAVAVIAAILVQM